MKIIVLCGGESSERQISFRSAFEVSKALISLGHEVGVIDPIAPVNEKTVFFTDKAELEKKFNLLSSQPLCGRISSRFTELLSEADTVFPIMHGGMGEDGRIQAILECAAVPFIGSDNVSCALSMDKQLTKRIYEACGILTPKATFYNKSQKRSPVPPCYPCIVKPSKGGSSFGVSAVYLPSALNKAVKNALSECDTVILEEMIIGRELSVSVLENEPLAVTEIIPKNAVFDSKCKYEKDGAREITPAPLSKNIYSSALKIAKNAHNALGLSGFSRTDIILQSGTDLLFALETNAIPGMTPESIMPNAAKSVGIEFNELIKRLLT